MKLLKSTAKNSLSLLSFTAFSLFVGFTSQTVSDGFGFWYAAAPYLVMYMISDARTRRAAIEAKKNSEVK